MRRFIGLCCLLLTALTAPAAAQGVLYRYEMHDATFFDSGRHRQGATAPFAVHRLGFIDESGVFASGLMSVLTGRTVGEGVDASGKPYTTYEVSAHPVVPGARGALEFAFEGPTELDVEVDGQGSTRDTEFDYFELRVLIGGSEVFGAFYATLDALDFVMRDVSGRSDVGTLRNDQYAFYSGLEVGALLPLSRVGAFARYDWIRGLGRLLSLGDEDTPAHTYDLGLVGSIGVGGLRVEARWSTYQWSGEAADGGGPNRVEGTMLSIGGQAAF